MGIALPQVVTESSASGAQIIDGSLKFDGSNNTVLNKTLSVGNRRTWTWSGWVKKNRPDTFETIFSASSAATGIFLSNTPGGIIGIDGTYDGTRVLRHTTAVFRDVSAWYHLVVALDTTQATDSNRIKLYVNGNQVDLPTATAGTWPAQNSQGAINNNIFHGIGFRSNSDDAYCSCNLSQVNFIDGQALDASYFGFTDGLTNTWRPKKYEGTFGTNGFYLPMDGNSPIGDDKSGQGNNWTPEKFGGSVALDNPIVSGARPILNTGTGGTVARPGVFGSEVGANYTVTVASVGGGNRYHFDGVDRPNPTLIRGATYTFDQSDSSNSNHPLRFATAADAAGSSQYTDGVTTNGTPGSAGAYTKITVPHNSPNTLHYYCTNHGGMGSSTSQITDETKADLYAWKNVLALPLVGSDDDVSNQINSGSTTKVTTSTNAVSGGLGNFYGGSWYFDGTGDYLTVSASSDFGLVEQDWTVECYAYIEGLTNGYGRLWYLEGDSSSAIDGVYFSNTNMSMGTATVWSVGDGTGGKYPQNKWIHIAVCHDSTNMRMYIDGVQTLTTSNNFYNSSSKKITLMSTNNGSYGGLGVGYIQDFRVLNGVAKYTSNFIPASTNPDILPDTPSGVSGSSKLTKVIDGAVAFDGSGDYLTLADSTDFDHQSTFTWECFLYLHAYDSSGTLIAEQRGSSTGMQWYINTSGAINFNRNGSTTLVTGGVFTLKRWNHVAVSHDGTKIRIFINGNNVVESTTSNVPDNVSEPVTIGRVSGYTVYDLNGFISNLRFVNGTALYTSNFTPPTAPLTNVTNTKLLCCQSNTPFNTGAEPILNTNSTGITTTSGTRTDTNSSSIVLALPLLNNSSDVHASIKGSGSNKTVTANGNAAASSAQSKYYGGSYVLDGTNDNLTIPASSDFDFGTGAYTIEMWFRTTADAGWLFYDAGNSNQGMRLCVGNNGGTSSNVGKLQFNEQVGNGDDPQNGTSLVNNGNWHHVAVCRGSSGDTTKMYVDGILEATGSANRNFDNNNIVYIGQRSDGSGTDFNGYIQDIRVYKGAAKYTSNFTVTAPSVQPIAAVSPSSLLRAGNAAATNFNPFNTDINTVRGQETGYCTWNPLTKSRGNLLDGNLLFYGDGTNTPRINGTISQSSGKWYYEATVLNVGPGTGSGDVHNSIGWGLDTVNAIETAPNTSAMDHSFYFMDSGYYKNFSGSNTNTSTGKWLAGDVIGVAADLDGNTLTFYKNGVQVLSQTIGTTAGTSLCPAHQSNTGTYGRSVANFGQKPFKFPPPAGFQPLNAANVKLDTVVGINPDQYVGTILYVGAGATKTFTGLNFGDVPDLVWMKNRDRTSYGDGTSAHHYLYDTVRGTGTGKMLTSSTNEVEGSKSTEADLDGFVKNGFRLDAASGTDCINNSGDDFVAWCWKAGGNKNTFNVDDVGYANASDVGMNVGGQNSNAYDQTQTWSSGVSGAVAGSPYDATKMFDGSLTTYTDHNAQNSTITWTRTLTGVTSLKVYIHQGNNTGTVTTVGGNGTQTDTISTDFGPDWHNIVLSTTGSTINSIAFTRGGSGNPLSIYAVEVNGVMYVDNGVTPPGAPSIAPTGASVGTKQGFSIVKYTGNQTAAATVPHGLSQIPDFAIVKQLTGTSEQWRVRHKSTPDFNKTLFLNLTNAQTTNTEYISNFSSTTVTLSSGLNGINGANSYIMYVWHDVPGLQKFGPCKGSGASAAPDFVELGFKPSIVWVKRTDNTGNWRVWDSTRNTFNPSQKQLFQNTNGAEQDVAADAIDILSNGFAIRSSSAITQTGSQTYIYCAWAEAPTFNLFGGQSNAF